MPSKAARILAFETTIADEELEAAISYLNDRIDEASLSNDPVPFLAYRNRVIFQTTLKIRRHGG